MKQGIFFLTILMSLIFSNADAQKVTSDIDPDKKFYIGSSLFMGYGLFVEPSPEYYQLNIGY